MTPPRAQKRGRKVVAGVAAWAFTASLAFGAVAPTAYALNQTGQAIEVNGQRIDTANLSGPTGIVLPSSVSDVEIATEPATAPTGATTTTTTGSTVDLSGLTDTKLEYPFAEEVPLTDGFGYRTAPVAQFHDAQDMAAGDGTEIRIVGDGVVSEAGFATDGCGFALSVEHLVDGQNITSRYCHMQANSNSYQVGDTVSRGDTAGRVGQTGMAFGSHLHMIIRVEGEAVDPLPFIEKNSAS